MEEEEGSLRPGDKTSTWYEGRGEDLSELGRSMEFVDEIFEPTLEYGLEGILKYKLH